MPSINKYRIYCITESNYFYTWSQTLPTVCPNNNGHSINSSATTIVDILDSLGDFDINGRLTVNTGEYTEFGEQKVSNYNPILQTYALYNIIHSQMYDSFLENGGTISGNTNGIELNVNITSTNGSNAILKTNKVCKYRPGHSITTKFNTIFATPIANLLQFSGLGNIGNELCFCYNGTNFGIRYSNSGLAEVRTFTVTTAENSTRTAVITLNGVAYNASLITAGGNTSFTAFQIARANYGNTWSVYSVANVVIFTATKVGPRTGTYSYSAGGGVSAGTFAQKKAGVALTTTFINRLDWNGNSSMITNLDPLMRNMYSIEYAWYGSSNIYFKIYNPTTSNYETVHVLKFANTQTAPSLTNPNMYIQQGLTSEGSTTAKTITVSGSFAATSQNYIFKNPLYNILSSKTISANTDTVILAVRNRSEISGFFNTSEVFIRGLSMSCDGTKAMTFKVIRNPTTLSGNTTSNFTNWQYVDEFSSLTLSDTTSTTYTGGNILATYYLAKLDSQVVDLIGKETTIFKDDVIIITALSTAGSDVQASITLIEDF